MFFNILRLRLVKVCCIFVLKSCFTRFYDKNIHQLNYFKAIHENFVLRNYMYNASVLDRHTSSYHCSIQEIYLSNEIKKICKSYINAKNVISCRHLTRRRRKDREIIRINCHAYYATTRYTNFSNNKAKSSSKKFSF